MGCFRMLVLGLGLAVACGPSVGSVQGDASTAADVASSSTGPLATTSSTSSSTSASVEGTSSTTASIPEIVELEGPLAFRQGAVNSVTYFLPCGGGGGFCLTGDHQDVWHCNGAYARLRGYEETIFQGLTDDPCGGVAFHVTEVVESRLCEPGDCSCRKGLDCETTCFGASSCGDGSKCVPWTIPGSDSLSWACAEVSDDPVSPDDVCANDPLTPWKDDCDASSVCLGGRCRPLCGSDAGCGVGRCISVGVLGLCFEPCNPLSPQCDVGETCLQKGGGFACMNPDASFLEGPQGCGDAVCAPGQRCVQPELLLDCLDEACCTETCDLADPLCPGGLVCMELDFWSPRDYPELVGVGVCRLPDL